MTPRNIGASIRQRLLERSRESGENFQRLLTRYAIERFLYRLAQTHARESYILKGAMLFATWPQHIFRPTGDLDLLGRGNPGAEALLPIFREICAVEMPNDGIVYDPNSLSVEAVREEENYQGVRLKLRAVLDGAEIPFQVDIGFGDLVTPEPEWSNFPCLLDNLPPANIQMYPPETVIAEKFEAMIRFGEETSRLKDFYDIWVVSQTFNFELSKLVEAVGGTLRRRQTAAPIDLPIPLTAAFGETGRTQGLWTGFLRRTPLSLQPPSLVDLLSELRGFLGPVINMLDRPEAAHGRWSRDSRTWELR